MELVYCPLIIDQLIQISGSQGSGIESTVFVMVPEPLTLRFLSIAQ